jgi:glycosyltransferase 2 family protein
VKALRLLILAAGLATLGVLLWKLDVRVVWGHVSQVGWGIIPILAFQIADHALNALGWRFAFAREHAARAPFWRLVKVRIAGDGVNYLTPSGQIAGELVRPAMLGDVLPEDVKNSSVLAAKVAQALAQAVFIQVGLLFVLLGKLKVVEGREMWLSLAGTLLVVAFVALAIYATTATKGPWERWLSSRPAISGMRDQMRGYMRKHPGRFMLSTLFFILGYAWGMIEILLICHFMGLHLGALKALAVETLSNVVDSVMFMVPAKVGTQEAGKVVIFKALGYPASAGLALGLIRHLREIVWASAGLVIYALNRPKEPGRPARSQPGSGLPGPSGSTASRAR